MKKVIGCDEMGVRFEGDAPAKRDTIEIVSQDLPYGLANSEANRQALLHGQALGQIKSLRDASEQAFTDIKARLADLERRMGIVLDRQRRGD